MKDKLYHDTIDEDSRGNCNIEFRSYIPENCELKTTEPAMKFKNGRQKKLFKNYY